MPGDPLDPTQVHDLSSAGEPGSLTPTTPLPAAARYSDSARASVVVADEAGGASAPAG